MFASYYLNATFNLRMRKAMVLLLLHARAPFQFPQINTIHQPRRSVHAATSAETSLPNSKYFAEKMHRTLSSVSAASSASLFAVIVNVTTK